MLTGRDLGNYRVLEKLGEGGMGEVYRARDTRLDRLVAVKVLPALFAADPDRLARFEREAKSVAQLSHPNILNIFDFGVDGPTAYAVMELLEGETLADRLTRGPLAPRKAIDYAIQIAHGLAAAHGKGIAHRDVKPQNLFVTADERVKILDFGLAKPIEIDAAEVTRAGSATAAGMVMGTVGYMAPEQVRAQPADHRADIFAFGVVLYEMVSGQRAFGGESAADTMSAILNREPPDLDTPGSALYPALDRIIRRCLEKKPELRFQSAQDLAFALETLSSRTSGAAVAVPPPAALRPWSAALPWVVAAIAVVAAVASWLVGPRAPSTGGAPGELRLSIMPPVGQQFAQDAADFDPEFAISPDGRQVVFVAVEPAGASSLWVRDLSSVTPRQLGGTDGATRPVWSHDGRHILFLSPSGLNRIAVESGARQGISTGRIAPTPNSNHAWGAAGQILFEANVAGGDGTLKRLYLVPENGGVAVAVSPAGSGTAQAHRFPVFLPDGRRFLYLNWTPKPEDRAIFLASTEGGEGRPLVQSGFRPAFVAPDVLLYIKDSVLVAERFSADEGRMLGDPRTIVEGLALEAIPGGASFTASPSGVIGYRSRSRDLASELRWVTRQGRVEPPLVSGSDITVALAPNGRWVALTRVLTTSSRDDRFPSNVWLHDLQRGVASRFTLDANATDENALWSHDGGSVAYASHREGGLAEVFVQSATRSGAARLVASGPENFHPIDWARDGTLLLQAYATGGGSDDIDLWALGPEPGAAPRPFIQEPANQAQGQFSPDGRWVAYSSDESGRFQVYVRGFPSGHPRVQISSEGGGQPRWRKDGREIFYVSHTGTVFAVPLTAGSDLTAGVPVPLFTEPSLRTHNNVFFYGGGAAYDVTPDGQRFLVSRLTVEPSSGPVHVVIDAIGRRR